VSAQFTPRGAHTEARKRGEKKERGKEKEKAGN
jgi:hypothetical protein